MPENLELHQQRFRRGRLLALLEQSNDQGCSEPVLRMLIREWGYKTDLDTFAIDLNWLARHGLITRREVVTVGFAKITPLGRDVVHRDTDVPGVVVLED